jgi:hypothetical protein
MTIVEQIFVDRCARVMYLEGVARKGAHKKGDGVLWNA